MIVKSVKANNSYIGFCEVIPKHLFQVIVHRVRKKSLQYFGHIFDKLKPIFIIFGTSRLKYLLD